jgi:hypothetical protein
MSSETSENSLTFYASILSGSLLMISEILPYISKIKGNGIFQALTNLFSNYEEQKKKEKLERDQKIQEISDKVDEVLKKLDQEFSMNNRQ